MNNKIPQEIEEKIRLLEIWNKNEWERAEDYKEIMEEANNLFSNKNTMQIYEIYLKGFKAGQLQKQDDELNFLGDLYEQQSVSVIREDIKGRIKELKEK